MKQLDDRQAAVWAWMIWYRAMVGSQGDLIREALDAGLSRRAIAEAMGLSRQHLYDIVPAKPKREANSHKEVGNVP